MSRSRGSLNYITNFFRKQPTRKQTKTTRIKNLFDQLNQLAERQIKSGGGGGGGIRYSCTYPRGSLL